MTGWPDKQITPEITLYFSKHHEITVEVGCLLWEIQAIIPTQLCKCVLFKLRQRYSHNPTEMQKLSEVTVGTRILESALSVKCSVFRLH